MNIPSLFLITFCIRLILSGEIQQCLFAFVSPCRLFWNACLWYSVSYTMQLSYPTEMKWQTEDGKFFMGLYIS